MRKTSGESFQNSGPYTSPGTPEYGDHDVGPGGTIKAWSSERVPLPANSYQRNVNIAAFGRTLPSKWDDAERWITSPVSGYSALRKSFAQVQRRPRSKSGPLGPTGLVYFPTSVSAQQDNRNFMMNSPLTTGVLLPDDGLSVHFGAGNAAKTELFFGEKNISRSTSVPGLSDQINAIPEQSSPGGKHENWEEEDALVPQRDMATQMSPDRSTRSSSKNRLSFSILSSTAQVPASWNENTAAKEEIRDVQVDKSTTSKMSKKHGRNKIKGVKKSEFSPSTWNDETEQVSKDLSKIQREEAKIAAWENLQKAKAEAAIRKLEMKLEKKRSATMDKIADKLRQSQMKAQAKRNMISDVSPATSRKGCLGCSYFGICFCCNRNRDKS